MDLCVRPMTEPDCDAVGELRVSGWRSAYAGLMPRSYLDAMDPAEDAALRRRHLAGSPAEVVNLVAERARTVVGWACLGPLRGQEGPGKGELYALYVRPALFSTGIGRALLAAGLAHAEQAGYTQLLLWVVEGNTRARRFYEKASFAADGATRTDPVDGVPVTEVRYRRPLT